jgi:biotin transport system substrate-specific component
MIINKYVSTFNFEGIRSNSHLGIILSFIFAAFIGFCALIVIPLPFTPIPITFQTFAILMSGVLLGRKYGPLSIIIYLILGAVGIPWFAGGNHGIAVILGVTAGYLIGFLIASLYIGYCFETGKETRAPFFIVKTLLIATVLIYLFGGLGLYLSLGIDLMTTLQFGVLPFLPGDLFKLLLAFIFSVVYLPKTNTTVDHNLTTQKTYLLFTMGLLSSFVVLLVFIFYLFSTGEFIPQNLLTYSIFTSLLILSTFLSIIKLSNSHFNN